MEGTGEKKHPPSHRKLWRLRQDGTIPISRDLTGAVVLAVGVGVFAALLEGLVLETKSFAIDLFTSLEGSIRGERHAREFLGSALVLVARFSGSVVLAMFLAGGIVARLQAGEAFAARTLVPRMERLDPFAAARQMFLTRDAWLGRLLLVFKVLVLAAIVGWALLRIAPELVRASGQGLDEAFAVAHRSLCRIAVPACAAFLGLGCLDFVRQRRAFTRKHAMSDQERREEYESDEGKPEVKSARKQLAREILARRTLLHTATADVLTVNPTHLACAVVLDRERDVPRLVARGEGLLAEAMRETAKAHGIPIRADVPLTRAMYRLEEGQMVPERLWVTLRIVFDWAAEILRSRGEEPSWIRNLGGATDTPSGR